MENKVKATLSDESIAMMKEAMLTFSRELPFLIELTPAESRRITRMESKRVDFVRKALITAQENPSLLPNFFDVEAMRMDIDLCQALDQIAPMLEKLVRQVNDTRSQAGHEAYGAGLNVYDTTKRAALNGVPGAKNAYEEMKVLFEGQGKNGKAAKNSPSN